MEKLLPKSFKIRLHRYEAILLGSVLLLSGTVTPSGWEPVMPGRPGSVLRLAPGSGLPATIPVPVYRPRIALTFDDGPHPMWTERLLNVLEREQVPATFFVVGRMAVRHPGLLQRIADKGHELANHTYSHPRLSRLSSDAVLQELAQTRAVIRNITGRDTFYYRPPGGAYSRRWDPLESTCRHASLSIL